MPLKSENTGGATGWCLETHDLAVSKLIAGREKDLDFLGGLVRHALADAETLERRLAGTALAKDVMDLCRARLERLRSA